MQILFNGQPRSVPPNTTVADLLIEMNLTPKHVAVEINLEVIPREQHPQHQLREGDELEVVTLVGGG